MTIQFPFLRFIHASGKTLFQAENSVATVEFEPAAFLEAAAEAGDLTPHLIRHYGGGDAVKTFFKSLLADPDLATEMLGLLMEGDGPADFLQAREVAFAEIIKANPRRALDAIPTGSIADYVKNIVKL